MRGRPRRFFETETTRSERYLMAAQAPPRVAYCGRCGAPLAPGATFCGRCGTPVAAQAVASQPVYSYAIAPPAVAYPPARRRNLSQIAIAGALLAILLVWTVVVSAIAATHLLGNPKATWTVNCA